MVAFGSPRGLRVKEAEYCREARALIVMVAGLECLVDWMLPDISDSNATRSLESAQ